MAEDLPEDNRKDGRTDGNPSHRNNNKNPVLNRQLAYRKRKKKKKHKNYILPLCFTCLSQIFNSFNFSDVLPSHDENK
jgi:hypothetical protein